MSKQVGDIDSNEKGSGARYNSGKPDYSMLVLSDFAQTLDADEPEDIFIKTIIKKLGEFQSQHNPIILVDLLRYIGDEAIEESTYVFTYGASKYKSWNWAKGSNWSIPLACAVRHCLAIYNGEEVDKESERKHIGHVVCNIFMLIHYSKYYIEGNDLPSKELFQ